MNLHKYYIRYKNDVDKYIYTQTLHVCTLTLVHFAIFFWNRFN